jgi:excisionase family DNA binding protein
MSQAREMLGVSEATLRHWTDEGKIRAFITPGGHRRYAESELRDFMGAQRRVHGMENLVAKMESVPLDEIHLARSHFASASWYNNLNEDSKARLRELGSRLHHLAIEYLTKKKKQDETMQTAREIGREFGEHLAGAGVSLTDSVAAFLLHRTPFINAANELVKGREGLRGRAAEAIPMLAQITDEVLLSLVEAHQERHSRRHARKPRQS